MLLFQWMNHILVCSQFEKPVWCCNHVCIWNSEVERLVLFSKRFPLEFKEHKWKNISASVLTSAVSGSSKMSTYSNLRNVHSQANLALWVGAAPFPPHPWLQMYWTINILRVEQVTLQQNSLNAMLGNSLKSSLCHVGSTGWQRGRESDFPPEPACAALHAKAWKRLSIRSEVTCGLSYCICSSWTPCHQRRGCQIK